nr:MAG TPA: tail tape measure [Caudoviricetes sp.]
MSQTIDHRVVEMKFDNKQFESGAATTMSTLDKLKKSLDFSKVGDSFKNIDKAADKVDISGLDKAINRVESNFSALEVMAITTLGNITNSFVNSAKRWASAFTIDPIKSGFQEYETQINAVQTILANTQKEGTNIKDVNAALDELNLYADKTIYNFTEMTRNIGTFTAAGVDLKTSVSAIQGIANLAAVSGSNSQQASTAMYQLSQALSSGTVKLMDWNSVVNAGMGGQLFQDALKETSRLLGTGADEAIKAEGSFRESLKTGWLTSEVLTETLKKFTTSGATEYVAKYTGLSKEAVQAELDLAKSTYGEAEAIDKAAESLAKKSGKNKEEIAETLRFAQTAEDAATKVKTFTQLIDTLKEAVQSGWSQSFRIIIGDFEDAKTLFTEISDSFGAVISASADARNALLSEVFNKKDAQDYMAALVDAPKDAILELQTVAKEAGTSSDLFKDTLNVFTKGDATLNKVMTDMIGMVNSEKDVVTYISDMTGIKESSIKELQNLGKEAGYTSDEFKELASVLAKGDPEMQATITSLLEMNDALEKPSGRELLIDSLRNGMKGLLSVIKPVKEAFREVFPPATAEQVYGMLDTFHSFTETLVLSDKNSENLKKTFKGLFDVVKLLGDGFGALVKLIIPVEKPIGALGDGILGLTGGIGSLLSMFSKCVRSSELLNKAFGLAQKGSSKLMGGISSLIKLSITFVEKLSEMEGPAKLINSVGNAFEKLYKKASPYIEDFISESGDMLKSLFNFEDINIDEALRVISEAFVDLAWEIDHFSFETIENGFDTLKSKVQGLSDLLMGNNGIATFIKNFKEYGEELRDAFALDNLLDRLERVMDIFGKFFNWIKTTMAPTFKDFNLGTAAASAGGLGIVYSLIKMSKAFENMSNVLSSVPELLGGVKDTLKAYQKDLKADVLIKTAGAIAILAGALVLLSFADTERLVEASIALSLIAGVLMLGVLKLLDAANKGKELNNALTIFSKGLSKTMKDLGKAVKIKAIGSAVKDFATSIALIAGSIIALGIMWDKNPAAFSMALKTVGGISLALVAIGSLAVVASKVMKKEDIKELISIGKVMTSVAASLMIVVLALDKLMKISLPSDYGVKLGILGGMLLSMALLAVAVGVAGRIAGGKNATAIKGVQTPISKYIAGINTSSGGGSISAGPIIALAGMLYATVSALDKLFKMTLPSDYGVKLGILGGMLLSMAGIAVVIGYASKLAGDNTLKLKAAGTILAMTAFLAVVVGALFVLTLIPADKMLKGALALGEILLALGAALYGAGKISDENTYKSVIAMAITVGVITTSLAVLSMIPWNKLIISAGALGAVLLTLAVNFSQVSKIKSKKALPAILAMIAASVAIAYSLYVLSEQPWKNLLSAAVAMSLTLLAFSKSFETILGKRWSDNNLKKIGTFLLLTLAVIPIGIAIGVLAQQPWSGLLAAAAGLSLVLLAMTGCFVLISKVRPNMAGIASFLLASLSVTAIALGLDFLAQQPLDGILAATLALGLIIAEVAGLMLVCTVVGSAAPAALAGIGIMAAVIAALTGVVVALGALMNLDGFQQLLNGGIQAMTMLGEAIGGFIGGIVSGALTQISSSLPQIGSDLSQFMINLGPFIAGSKMIDAESLACVGFLAAIILALTAAEVINGIASLFGLSLVDMAVELSNFIVALTPFIVGSKQLSVESMEACGYLAGMILKLTAANVISGIANFFGLSGSISDFGKELSEFGPYIKKFAEDVKDVKPEAVQGAAAAAEIMAEVAKKLPGTDGLVQKIFGEKSLAEFGEELVLFGPKIKQFGEMVKDVKPEAVEGAASAAEIMANLADKLPAQDGLLQKIMGEKSLSDFGRELIAFGPLIKHFANTVADIKPESVTGVQSITEIMTTLANNLPSSDTLWEKLFGGGQKSISEFGTELVGFGDSMSLFSQSISGVDSTSINEAIAAFKSLVDLANYVGNASATSITEFATELTNVGATCVDNFVLAFADSTAKVTAGINTMIAETLTAITNRNAEFLAKGAASVNQFLQGFRNKYGEAITTGKALGNNVLKGCQSLYSSFYRAGANGGQGFVDGLKSKMSAASSAGAAIGTTAYDAAKKALDEHSPSKKMGEVGENAGLGFINTLMLYVAKAANAGKDVGKAAVDGTKSGLQMLDDIGDIVLHPRVMMDDVYSSVKEIEDLFNNAVVGIRTNAMILDTQVQNAKTGNAKNDQDVNQPVTSGVTNYNFNQYNTSPKSLSRIEIYRQTNNQFRQFKEVTNPT